LGIGRLLFWRIWRCPFWRPKILEFSEKTDTANGLVNRVLTLSLIVSMYILSMWVLLLANRGTSPYLSSMQSDTVKQ
jgi:hypothetical protein